MRWRRGRDLAGALPQGVVDCWCAASAGAGCGLRKGLDRAAGSSVGLGTRAAGRVGRKDLRSCVGTPRMLRLLRDPVTNAEAFDLRRAKEASWVPLGVGWAALLPSRGTVHEKGEALPPLTRWEVDLPPVERSESGGSTDGQRQRRFLRPPRAAAREQSRRAANCPVEALSERRTSRSRTNAAPPEREAAPAQPHSKKKPHQRSPTRTTSRADAPAGRAKPNPHAPPQRHEPPTTRSGARRDGLSARGAGDVRGRG